jgi:hypothetical protein
VPGEKLAFGAGEEFTLKKAKGRTFRHRQGK